MTSYGLASGVLRASLEDEEVLLNTDTGIYHLLNGTGLALLGSMESGASFASAVDALVAASGEAPERVRTDAETFLAAMLERGLLEAREPDSASP
jgi:hypothetical protein